MRFIKYYIILLILCIAGTVRAQETTDQTTSISGVVVDEDTGETLPFVQIWFMQSSPTQGMIPSHIGTTSDLDGNFSISNTSDYTTVNFQMVGYKTEMYTLRKGQNKTNVKIKLKPDVYGLQDLVVTPKNRKRDYKRQGNPAVELIQNVIAHKDSFCVKAHDQYTAKTYHRMSFSLDNIKVNWEKPFWRKFKFVQKYVDTTGVYPNVTVSIREALSEEYYQRRPHREKKITKVRRNFGIEDIIGSASFQENVNAIFKDVEINDNNMNLLFNRFVSPLSSTLAVTFYQYYIMDTLMVDGYPCIDLAFVPVNSQSFGFTGHLYIVNDSTFRLKKYAINVPPEINLNFVSNFSVEHDYKQLENGLWAPDRTTTYAKFYILNHKRGMLARQTKIYTDWDLDTPIAKETFSSLTSEEPDMNDSTAQWVSSADWENLRPEPLSWYEGSVEELVHEFTSTPAFNSLALLGSSLATGYIPTEHSSRMWLSKFYIGPIYNFVSWNMLEGVRLRFGGASTSFLHDQWYFRGYVAFGTKDLRPKYSATVLYTFDKHEWTPYTGLRHHIQVTGQYDVEEPGVNTETMDRDNIFNSIPTSKPTLGYNQYVFHANVEYLKEWQNKLSLRAKFDFSNNEAAGILNYDRVQWNMNPVDSTWSKSTSSIGSYRNYEGQFELRYSPGNRASYNRMGKESTYMLEQDAPTVKLTHYIGYLDDRHNGGDGFLYNRTEFFFDKRFWLSAFGHIDLRIESGMIWQKVPFTQLYMPRTGSSIFFNNRAFNQMKAMEFIMDEYISLYATYYLKGWLINRIPGLNRLKIRGVVGVSAIYGGLTKKNNPFLETGSGLYEFPTTAQFDHQTGYLQSGSTCSPIGKLPYIEINAGFENIFKFIRIDYIRRITYNDYELPYKIQQYDVNNNPMLDENGDPVMIQARRRIPAWGRNGVKVTFRFAL